MTEQVQPSAPKGIKLWLMAARAYSFPASIIPVLFGSVLAVFLNPEISFNYFLFILTLIGSVSVQIGTNLINDIYDFKIGIDKADKDLGIPHGGSMVLSMGILTLQQMKRGAFMAFTVALLIGLYLYYSVLNPWILYLIIFGFLSAVYYTAAPVALKYKALGDLQVILSFGAGMTLGAYIVQTGFFDWKPLIFSIPLGLLIDAILHSNNIRDVNFDGKFGVKTLPMLIGENASKIFYYFLIAGAYLSVIIFVLLGELHWLALLSLVTLPVAIKLIKMLDGLPQEPQARFEYGSRHIMMTAQLNMSFGITLTVGLLIAYFVTK